jgi:Rap guanine nucleotide exchange factor 2
MIDLQELMDPSRNMYKYRNLLTSSFQTPMIPFYPVVKKDLTFIDLGNSTVINQMINFEKMRMVSKEIRTLIQMSAAPFDTSGLASVAAMNQLVNKEVRSLTTTTGKKTTFNNKKKNINQPKKMYEEMNMIRKVKAYLRSLEIIQDENVLYEMSLCCESNFSGSTNSVSRQLTLIKKPPSPTLSTSSSNSNKFGSNSPHSYRKLLALSSEVHSIKKKVLPSVPLFNRSDSSATSLKATSTNLNTESSSVLPGVIKE